MGCWFVSPFLGGVGAVTGLWGHSHLCVLVEYILEILGFSKSVNIWYEPKCLYHALCPLTVYESTNSPHPCQYRLLKNFF